MQVAYSGPFQNKIDIDSKIAKESLQEDSTPRAGKCDKCGEFFESR